MTDTTRTTFALTVSGFVVWAMALIAILPY